MVQSPAISGVVLINVDRGKVAETAEAMLELPEVGAAYSMAGAYDLVAMLRVREYVEMAEGVPCKIANIQNIARATPLMAFQRDSRRDLERMWDIGPAEESALVDSPSRPAG